MEEALMFVLPDAAKARIEAIINDVSLDHMARIHRLGKVVTELVKDPSIKDDDLPYVVQAVNAYMHRLGPAPEGSA